MRRVPSERGLTLSEIIIGVGIIGIVAAIAVPAYGDHLYRSRVTRAIGDVNNISARIKIWASVHNDNRLPDSLAEVGLETTSDPWGHPYQYLRIEGMKGKGDVRKDHKLNPLNSDYDLYSSGRDGVSKTQISNKDSLDDIVRANDGAFVGLASDF